MYLNSISRLFGASRDASGRLRNCLIFYLFYFSLTQPTLGVAASHSALLYIILCPVGSYFKNTSGEDIGVSLLADPRYTRAWPGGCGDRKMGSNYAPTIHVQREACEKGLQQVLWLYGDDNQLTEVGTMNIFMVYVNDDGGNEGKLLIYGNLIDYLWDFN